MPKKPFFADTTTFASRPGRVRVDLRVWVRCFPRETLPMLAFVTFSVFVSVIMLVASPADAWGLVFFFAIAAGGVSFFLWQKATLVKENFEYGCLNPAVVVTVNPYQIAVYGDLTTQGNDVWPAIKILSQPLGKTQGRRMQVGDRLATVSVYSDANNSRFKPHWDDFYPTAVNCVTDDDTVIRDALWRLNQSLEEEWNDLERYLASVPKPYRPGLYWMRTE